jgi:ribonuclease D
LFYDVIALIQISCSHFDFVLDSFLLFPFLKVKLVPILQSTKIVKLIFSENDVRSFIRDYEMYFVGCVDLQDVCSSYLREKNLYNKLDKISLSKAVKLTLGIELDKEYQLYPWINRPINCKAMSYATTDSKVLLMLWSYLKSNTYINTISLKRSKEILIKYQFPVRKNCWIDHLANFIIYDKYEM